MTNSTEQKMREILLKVADYGMDITSALSALKSLWPEMMSEECIKNTISSVMLTSIVDKNVLSEDWLDKVAKALTIAKPETIIHQLEVLDLENTYAILVKSHDLFEKIMESRESFKDIDHPVYLFPDFENKGVECLTKEDIERLSPAKPVMTKEEVEKVMLNLKHDGVNVITINLLKEPSYLGCEVLKLNEQGAKYLASKLCIGKE